ncbi:MULTISPECIES: YerC/YecD family TrpR-related protein [Kytococcus]|uniref:DNA-binding transcriptional regulator n=1 Tax=Kytococcus schroeteri TaxID=138300 RepID=A0A2I1P9F4_9MICO|nr:MULTISPECIES: YerC/YecD family TrpR-related protein [Kytococcus]OFS12918.1 DNA-binding transcriptional regulator [Kytococcus sp. HMSC28H12]PKZ41266.1 DNA-binding transcriptional regulator [Kytococcus schroeteri]
MKRRDTPRSRTVAEVRAELVAVLASMQDPAEVDALLTDLCTPAEVEALTDRWAVVPQLAEGRSYRAIHEDTGVSVTTVGRVARCLEDGAGGYRAALRHLDGPASA